MAHVGYQYLGSIGKLGNGIVAVTSLWADERVYSPLHVRPSTPAARLAGGKQHPAFRTKPQLALALVQAVRRRHPLARRGRRTSPVALAVKPSQVVWTPAPDPESPSRGGGPGALGRRERCAASGGLDGGGALLP
jgi:hypothetical protein